MGSIGISVLFDDETLTVQEPVTSCGCRRWSCRCANHEVIWENVGRHIAAFVIQLGIRWKVIRQLHGQFIVTTEKQPAVHTAYEAGWDPVPVCRRFSCRLTFFRFVFYLLYCVRSPSPHHLAERRTQHRWCICSCNARNSHTMKCNFIRINAALINIYIHTSGFKATFFISYILFTYVRFVYDAVSSSDYIKSQRVHPIPCWRQGGRRNRSIHLLLVVSWD